MFIHLLYTYLTVRTAFSLTLNTMAFVHSTSGWFGTSTCMTVPAGPPPSSVQHSCLQAATLLGRAFVAHNHLHNGQFLFLLNCFLLKQEVCFSDTDMDNRSGSYPIDLLSTSQVRFILHWQAAVIKYHLVEYLFGERQRLLLELLTFLK